MRRPVISIIILVLSIAFLSACGQKGPLFLPGNPSSLREIPSTDEQRDVSDEEDDEEKEEQKDPNSNP
jgi:predicted small lipoprotein YifL